jgi:hypothetical protein
MSLPLAAENVRRIHTEASKVALESSTRSLSTQSAADKLATFKSVNVGPTETDGRTSVVEDAAKLL